MRVHVAMHEREKTTARNVLQSDDERIDDVQLVAQPVDQKTADCKFNRLATLAELKRQYEVNEIEIAKKENELQTEQESRNH